MPWESTPHSSGPRDSGSSMTAKFAERTKINQQQLRYFAVGIYGLMGIFIVFHWIRYAFNKSCRSSKSPVLSAIARPFTVISRNVRNLLVRSVPCFSSSGHTLLVAAYVAINLSLTFTNVEIASSSVANRCGWILSANFALVVFLALKNTPLAILSAYSYERLNILHQMAGYTAFVYLILHASMYTHYFLTHNKIEVLQEPSVVAGIVAGFGFLGVFISAVVIRRIWYEVFYITHVTCFIIALVCASYHQHSLEDGIPIIFAVIAGIWVADRAIRLSRMLYRAVNNEAIIEPLPHGGTKITLAKKPHGVVPGKHCFVWIPKIRTFESHPFTVVTTEPMEFIVNAYDGFTRDLHKYALAHPGAKLRASLDGPYGTFPDPMGFDKVVLIAGGSGASFTFGFAVNMLERMGSECTKSITFIWAVKKHENLSWFENHLSTLRTYQHSPHIHVSLHVTDAPNPAEPDEQRRGSVVITVPRHSTQAHHSVSTDGTNSPTTPTGAGREIDEKTLERAIALRPTAAIHNNNVEKSPATTTIQGTQAASASSSSSSSSSESLATTYNTNGIAAYNHHHRDIRSGRPDTAALIRDAIMSTPSSHCVLVAACGPDGLTKVVRNTTASLIRSDGPGVELHCEQFGW